MISFIRLLLITMVFFGFLNAEEKITSSALMKQKLEVIELKKDFNNFYNKKIKEYEDRKKELDTILTKVEKEKKEIENLRDENLRILKDIKGEVDSKTAKIYNKMKAKIAASIFNQMISEGKVEDVFAIILTIKENKVTELMKYLSPENASMLTLMLKNYKTNNQKEG